MAPPYNKTKCCLMYSAQKGNSPKWEIFPEKHTRVAKLTKQLTLLQRKRVLGLFLASWILAMDPVITVCCFPSPLFQIVTDILFSLHHCRLAIWGEGEEKVKFIFIYSFQTRDLELDEISG